MRARRIGMLKFWEREDLVLAAIECDEVLFDQRVPRFDIVVERHRQMGTNAVVAVIAEPFSVPGKKEKGIEGEFVPLEVLKEAVLEKSKGQKDKALAALDLPDTVRENGLLEFLKPIHSRSVIPKVSWIRPRLALGFSG